MIRPSLFVFFFLVGHVAGAAFAADDEWSTPRIDTRDESGNGSKILLAKDDAGVACSRALYRHALWELNRSNPRQRVAPKAHPKSTQTKQRIIAIRGFFSWMGLGTKKQTVVDTIERPFEFVARLDEALSKSDSRDELVDETLRRVLGPEVARTSEDFVRSVLTYLTQSRAVQATDLILIRQLAEEFALDEIHVKTMRDTAMQVFSSPEGRTATSRIFLLPWGEMRWTLSRPDAKDDLSLAAQNLFGSLQNAVSRKRTIAECDDAIIPIARQAKGQLDLENFVRFMLEVFKWDRPNVGSSRRIEIYRQLMLDLPLEHHQIQRMQQRLFDTWYDAGSSFNIRKEVREEILDRPWGSFGAVRSSPDQSQAIAARDVAIREGISLEDVLDSQNQSAGTPAVRAEELSVRALIESVETKFEERMSALEQIVDEQKKTISSLKGQLTRLRSLIRDGEGDEK